MKSVLRTRGNISNLAYFLSWLSLVARVVGIPLSNEYGKMMLALRSVAAPITDMLRLKWLLAVGCRVYTYYYYGFRNKIRNVLFACLSAMDFSFSKVSTVENEKDLV
jgi:hypothetical protein